MLQLSGDLFMTNDYNTCIHRLMDQKVRVVSLDEGEQPLPEHPNIIKGTCLLPPPTALMAEIDGNAQVFTQQYQMHLASDVVNDYISTILAAMYRGMEVILYIPEYNTDSSWLKFLIDYLLAAYCIIPGMVGPMGVTQPCIYQNGTITDDINSARLFLIGCINVNEFLALLDMSLQQFSQYAPPIMFRIIREIGIPMNKLDELETLHQSLKVNPKAFCPLEFGG